MGATGDLANRKLYPALGSLAAEGRLPEHFAVVGVARTEMSDLDFAGQVRKAVAGSDAPEGALAAVENHGTSFRYVVGSFTEPDTFTRLAEVLDECDRTAGTAGNRIYYLATVPRVFGTIAEGLGNAGLAAEPEGTFRRIVIEKPFGHDLASSRALDEALREVFGERQIFRIDHYMAKETVQNILALRFTNAIFEPLWNRRYVDHVEITVAESAGVEHRGTFYEQSGALRDIVQNHVMQVLALTAMEPPASFSPDAIRDEKVKALRAVRRLDPAGPGAVVVRGQYTRGAIGGEPVPGYRDEEGVSPLSEVESYLALRLEIDNWRWAGVPFYLRTGKRLARRVTEVVLRYRAVPHLPLPSGAADSLEPNTMRLRIQPDEGIELSFAAKVPGSPFRVRTVPLSFTYGATFAERRPEAYERVLFDALVGDATLFLRADEVDQAWQIVQPLIDAFDGNHLPLALYPAGTWGPHEADELLIGCDAWLTP
jgi:glucose-6-phosphate 1-dehydrogenase